MAITRLGPNTVNLTTAVTGTLPVANGGTALTSGFKNGITEHDEFRLTSSKTASNTISDITANLARTTRSGFSLLGTGMTESSGIFTFPSTGIYLVEAQADVYADSGALLYANVAIDVTSNNSSYNERTNSWNSNHASSTYSSTYKKCFVDVTGTSNVKELDNDEIKNEKIDMWMD